MNAQTEDVYKVLDTRRSIRQFTEEKVPVELVKKVINTARFAPSAMNRQPWEFVAVVDRGLSLKLYDTIGLLAGSSIKPGRSAPVFIAVLGDPSISSGYEVDCAFAASNILHAAWAEGLGTCVTGSMDRSAVKKLLKIPAKKQLCWLIQMGYPAEAPKAVDAVDGNLKRSKDDRGRFLVPKRTLDDILHINTY